MPPTLIPDLYERIAQVLGRPPDRPTLLALSLTCHALRVVCLKALFSSIVLLPRICDEEGTNGYSSDDDDKHTTLSSRFKIKLKNMESLVDSNPRILNYVRALHIQSHVSNFADGRFVRILEGLTNVSVFAMSTFYVPGYGIIWGTAPIIKPFRFFSQQWDAIPEAMKRALQRLVGSPAIRDIDIRYFQNIPVAFFQSCREIRSLRLLYCSIADLKDAPPQTSSASGDGSFRLGAMEFGLGPRSIAPLLYARRGDGSAVVDVSALTSLSVHLDSEMEDMYDFLNNLRGIKHLCIDSQDYYQSNVPHLFARIHPDFLSTLETLRLALIWRTAIWTNRRMVPTDMLGAVSGFRVLHYLAISIVVHTTGHLTELMEDMGKLDELLTTNSQFSRLRKVVIDVSFEVYKASRNNGIDRRKWQALNNTHFIRLAANPLVFLDVTVKI